MALEADDQGRIYLEKRLRERYGERFHIVEHEGRLELLPIADDALSAARDAVGTAFDDVSIEELRKNAENRARRQAGAELDQYDD